MRKGEKSILQNQKLKKRITIPSGLSKSRKWIFLPLLFLLGLWYNPPIIHEIGHVIGYLLTGGIPVAIWWDRMAAVGGNQEIGRIAGPLGAIWIYSVIAIFFFKRKPYISAYCAGAAHNSLIYVRGYGFMDFQNFLTDVASEVIILGSIGIALYWLLWMMEFISPNYSLPWDRKREKKEVEQYLRDIGVDPIDRVE